MVNMTLCGILLAWGGGGGGGVRDFPWESPFNHLRATLKMIFLAITQILAYLIYMSQVVIKWGLSLGESLNHLTQGLQ